MMRIIPKLKLTAATVSLVLLATSGAVFAQEEGPTTTYKFGGYVKFDAMFSDYSDATPSQNAIIRQFYIPSQISVGNGLASSDTTADFQARESRLNFRADTKTAGGDSITAFVEMDFFTHADGNEIVSNSSSPRIRHAFIKYNKWTFGQTWSTFQDVSVLPEALDFVGPAESTTFIRQAMIRYTTGNLELAVENPETFAIGDDGTSFVPGHDTIPDLIARYSFKFSGGSYIRVAGVVRSLNIDQQPIGVSVDETGFGVSVSAKFKLGQNDIRAMVNYGDGVGRYVALGLARDAVVDTNLNSIETVELVSAFVSYRHFWNDQWRSNIMFGTIDIDLPVNTPATQTETASSFHVNLIYNPLPKLDIGAEIMYAERENLASVDGDFTRFIVSAKYAF